MDRLRSLIVLAAALLAGCGDQGPQSPAALVVTPTVPRVPMGGTLQLDAAVVNADGRAIEDEPLSFESAEPDVLTVSDGGLLRSVGSLDTVTITATSGDLATQVEVLVVPPPSALTVVPRSSDGARGRHRPALYHRNGRAWRLHPQSRSHPGDRYAVSGLRGPEWHSPDRTVRAGYPHHHQR